MCETQATLGRRRPIVIRQVELKQALIFSIITKLSITTLLNQHQMQKPEVNRKTDSKTQINHSDEYSDENSS